MTIEEELRVAMHTEVDDIDTTTDAWSTVQGRVRRRRVTRNVGASLLATAAVIGAIAGISTLLADDATDRVIVVPPATTPTTETTTPTPTTAVEEPVAEETFPGIWPFTSEAEVTAYEADPGVGMFFDAEATALEFAREYLGMPDPTLVEPAAGELDARFVGLTAKPGARMLTTVELHPFGNLGAYTVVNAYTNNITLTEPQSMQVVSTDIALAGTSTAFEATVNVEVRQDGQAFGQHLGETFVMGGSMGEMGPFEGSISIEPPTEAAGAVLLYTLSAEDGSVQEARVVRVQFGSGDGEESGTAFSVFFHRDEALVEVARTSRPTSGVLFSALNALFTGPTAEELDDGISSLFSDETADLLAGVNLRDGTAIVDLADTVNNASTSAGSVAFLDELNATVFQFATVERIEYRLQGSCEAFWTWLQRGGCELVERP